MTRSQVALAGTAAALAAAVSLLGGILREGPGPAAAVAGPAYPADSRSLVRLGLHFQQRARETADPSYYPRSEAALRRALALAPDDPDATAGLGSLALARHRFREALALGRKARRLAPGNATAYGIVGDALVELGRYREAFAAFDRMAALEPGLASYARVSYARELLGDVEGALAAMRMAADAAGPRGEPAAWARVQLGKLLFGLGRLDEAEREHRAALAAFPDYVHALDALAHVEAARGRLGKAIALERRAVEAVPLPQFAGTLADLYRAAGNERRAREQERLVGAIERLLVANGVRTDLETALFDVDHGIRLERALARARRAHAERPSVEADDVLAWALGRTGRCGEALRYSKRALRVGTLDALKFFHRGTIERCLGREREARSWFRRALALNPHFSVRWAPVAQEALR